MSFVSKNSYNWSLTILSKKGHNFEIEFEIGLKLFNSEGSPPFRSENTKADFQTLGIFVCLKTLAADFIAYPLSYIFNLFQKEKNPVFQDQLLF